MEDEQKPILTQSQVDYGILKQINTKQNLLPLSNDNYYSIKLQQVQNTPGADWLYAKYSDQHLNLLRLLHLVGFSFQLVALMVGEFLFKFSQSTHNVTPFTWHHQSGVVAWISIVGLGVFFIATMFQRNLLSMELVADQYGYIIFGVYFLQSLYLLIRNISDSLFVNILSALILSGLSAILSIVYKRVKYPDDGRYLVSRIEFLGAHVKLSLLTGWVLMNFVHRIFMCLSFSQDYDGSSQVFLNWENSSWSILVMCLVFVVGVIILSTYKDVFFAIILIYTFFGIYFMQAHEDVCQKEFEDNCSTNVSLSALVLGLSMMGFVAIYLAFNYDFICYLKRTS